MSAEVKPDGVFRTDSPANEICEALPAPIAERTEIYRYLGYAQPTMPRPAAELQIDAIIAETLPLLKPRGVYAVYPVAHRTTHLLELSGITIRGHIGEFLDQARRVAVFVVTIGEEISDRAQSSARSGDAFSAWVADAVGSWAVETAADALMLRVRCHLDPGEDLTLRYSPGYCGMDIDQQRNLFQLVPSSSVGVRLLPSMLMHPLKSISGLVGFAPKEAVAQHRSPCDLCPKAGCHMRRAG